MSWKVISGAMVGTVISFGSLTGCTASPMPHARLFGCSAAHLVVAPGGRVARAREPGGRQAACAFVAVGRALPDAAHGRQKPSGEAEQRLRGARKELLQRHADVEGIAQEHFTLAVAA